MTRTSVDRPRVVVIGLDGASLELLAPWIDEGLLPNLQQLINRGVSGGLESVVPPLTPPAWTTAVTGVNPGRHGVLNFARPRFGRRSLDFFGSKDRRVPALWDYLGAAGKRSLILHLPAANPPFPIDGVLVSGIPLTDLKANCMYPPSLKEELIANVPGYRLFPDTASLRGDRDGYFKDALETLRAHTDEAVYLMSKGDWDLLFTVWQPGDSLMHFYWKDMDGGTTGDPARRHFIRDYYREADSGIGRVVDAAGPDAHIVVMSDHGHTGVKSAVYLNKWLADNGYLKYVKSMRDDLQFLVAKAQRKMRKRLFGRGQRKSDEEQIMRAAVRMLEKFEKGIVWPKTKAHAEPPGYIWICSADRYPQGPVEPGTEYIRIRDEIQRGLAALRDPETGEPVFENIVTREEAFDGPAAADAPDLVVLGKPGVITEYNPMRGSVFGPARGATFNGYHVMRGMMVAAGPELRSATVLDGARIVDVAPTILHLLGLPVPDSMEGRVLEAALDSERAVRVEPVEVRFVPATSDGTENEAIEQSLRDLGYM